MTKSIPFQARQGDVLIEAIDKVPDSAKKAKPENGRVILAHGEATGHAHGYDKRHVAMYRDDGAGSAFITVSADPATGHGGADLTHEEHSAIKTPAGDYAVRIQSEYSPEAIRSVAD
jgi:hypothetical protein